MENENQSAKLSEFNAGLGMSQRDMADFARDFMRYGIGLTEVCCRSWYNPMRWIKGKIYHKRIKPKDFYI